MFTPRDLVSLRRSLAMAPLSTTHQEQLIDECERLLLEVYTHFWPSDEARTRDAIEAASAGWLAGFGRRAGALSVDSESFVSERSVTQT